MSVHVCVWYCQTSGMQIVGLVFVIIGTTDVSSACDDVNQDQQYGWGSISARRGYTVLHVQNESSASGQAPEDERPGRRVQRSQLRLAPPNGIPFI